MGTCKGTFSVRGLCLKIHLASELAREWLRSELQLSVCPAVVHPSMTYCTAHTSLMLGRKGLAVGEGQGKGVLFSSKQNREGRRKPPKCQALQRAEPSVAPPRPHDSDKDLSLASSRLTCRTIPG